MPYSQSMVGVPVRPIQSAANQSTIKQGHTFGNNSSQSQLQDVFGEHKLEKSLDGRKSGLSSQKDAKTAANHLDVSSNSGAVADELTEQSEANLKVPDDKSRHTIGYKSIQADTSTESTPQNGAMDSNLLVGDNGKTKHVEGKVEAIESTFDHLSNDKLGEVSIQDQEDLSIEPKKTEVLVNENKENQEGFLQKISPPNTELCEERSNRIHNDISGTLHPSSGADEGSQAILGSPDGTKSKLLIQHTYQDKNPSQTGGTQNGATQPSHTTSLVCHPRHQTLPSNCVSSAALQRGVTGTLLQAPPPRPYHQAQVSNNLSMQVRPQAPGLVAHPGQPFKPSEPFLPGGIIEPGSAPSLGRGPSLYGPQQTLERSIGPQASYNLSQPPSSLGVSKMSLGDSIGAHFRSNLPGAFDSRGLLYAPESQIGVQRPIHPSEAEIFSNQRPRPDSHFPGTVNHRPPHLPGIPPNVLTLNGSPGPDSSSKHGLRDERFKKLMHKEQLNPFPLDIGRRAINQIDVEDVPRQFPRPSHLDSDLAQRTESYSLMRPFDRGVLGKNYDTDLTIDGGAPSRILPPRHMSDALHPTDTERSFGFYKDSIGQADQSRGHSDFPIPGGYSLHFADGFGPRSPLHEYHRRGFGGHLGFSGVEEIDGQDFPPRFGDPSRFPIFRNHLQGGEFEGPGNFRMSEHVRIGDLIGQDRHFGPRNLTRHLCSGEPTPFGSHPGHSRIEDLSLLGNFDPFGGGHRPNHRRLGEPGFRSSFSHQVLADDGRFFAVKFHCSNLYVNIISSCISISIPCFLKMKIFRETLILLMIQGRGNETVWDGVGFVNLIVKQLKAWSFIHKLGSTKRWLWIWCRASNKMQRNIECKYDILL